MNTAVNRMLAILLFATASATAAAATPAAGAGVIDALMAALGSSRCEFQRNGTWYPAKRAEEHLRRKYDYLSKRGKAGTAEEFIALAGTRSSMSGQTYRVRCPGAPLVDSATWLRSRLREIRAAKPTGGVPR